MNDSTSKRRKAGELALQQITNSAGTSVVESLKDIAPALADWIIEFSYEGNVEAGSRFTV